MYLSFIDKKNKQLILCLHDIVRYVGFYTYVKEYKSKKNNALLYREKSYMNKISIH